MILRRNNTILLFLGDLVLLYVALILMLFISYFPFPNNATLFEHLTAFSFLIALWLLTFFVAGLYERYINSFWKSLTPVLFKTQVINMITAVFFFYLIPVLGITPKTNLFLYLFISFILLFAWRIYGIKLFKSEQIEKAMIFAKKEEIDELLDTVNKTPRYGLEFSASFESSKINKDVIDDIKKTIKQKNKKQVAKIADKIEAELKYYY